MFIHVFHRLLGKFINVLSFYYIIIFSRVRGAQLNEALQMQMEVQRRLSDQLEVQRNLKVKIEAQGRFLERIAEEYKNRPNVAKPPNKSFSPPISLPSLCEESESNAKEFESDSEVDKNEIRSRAPKRHRAEEDDNIPQRSIGKRASIGSESCAQQRMLMPRGSKLSYQSPEINFPWTATAYCQHSPLMPASYASFN